MSASYLLGLDVGTSACKALLLDRDHREVASGRGKTPWQQVPTGAEVEAKRLLASVIVAVERALAAAPPGRVEAIGIASMGEVGVVLDRRGDPMLPLIAWHDTRGADEARRLADDLGLGTFTGRTGLPLDAVPSLFKWRWLADHEPSLGRAVRRLNVAEWLVRALGGEEIGELSLASRTGMYDLHARAWWPEALAWGDVPPALLPEPVLAGTPAGRAKAGVLPAFTGAVLAVAGHDHLSAAVGAGAVGDGDVLDSCGTAEAVVRPVLPLDEPSVRAAVADEIGVGWHVVPERHNLLAAIPSGLRLSALVHELGGDRAALERAAAKLPDDAPPSRARTWRDALDEAAATTADRLARMERIAGPARRLVLTGGWAEGAANQAAKRRHLGPFEHHAAAFAGARGAALAAARALGADGPHTPTEEERNATTPA